MQAQLLSTPSATSGADRLVRMSRAMEWVTTAGIVLIAALMGAAFVIPPWARNLLLAKLGEAGALLPHEPVQQAMATLIFALPVVLMIWGLWHVRLLFREFAQGRVFTDSAARHLQRFGMSVLAQGPLSPLISTAIGLALSLGHPPGQRMLVLTFSINDYIAVIVGGVLVAVAAAMRAATRLADENASFV